MKHNSQDYLLTIWELFESFENANEKAVAERLGISLPSAWEGIHRLEKERQLIVKKQGLQFTNEGFLNAMKMVRAHRITEYFVYSFLEVPWDEVHNSVMDLEHDFTENLLANLYRKMRSPGYCPHGNPVEPIRQMTEIRASEAPEGKYYFVRPVLEEYTFLKKLLNVGATPGRPVGIEKTERSLYLIGENGEFKLPSSMEKTIRIRPKPKTSRKLSRVIKVPVSAPIVMSFPQNHNESHT